MHPPVGAAKKVAMRELRGLAPPTHARLAAICGVHSATVRDIAFRESWPKLNMTRWTVMRPMSPRQLKIYEAMLRAEAQGSYPVGDGATVLEGEGLPPGDIGAEIVTQMRVILAGLQAGHFDKARADGLLATIRVAERLGMLPAAGVQTAIDAEEQKRSDDELADILTRVDQRIVELARGYAERLVAAQSDAASG